MTWTPTAENINALPEGLRDYIHRLEANTDPAGMVRENVVLRERVAQLERMIEEAPEARISAAFPEGADEDGKYPAFIECVGTPPELRGLEEGKRVKLVEVG